MLSRNVARTFSSAAAARSASSGAPASVDLHGAVSQLVFAYPAGSRYQQVDEEGLVHTLRNCVGLMAVARSHADKALELLTEFNAPVCQVWDLIEVKKTLADDLQQQTPMDVVVELLHKAAYRNGPLANSVVSPEYAVGQVKISQLYSYMDAKLPLSSAVLVGVNVDHAVLLDYVSKLGIKAGHSAKEAEPSKYYGGEVRQSSKGTDAHVAIAGQGAPLSDVKAVAVQSVLSYIIGTGPNVKYPNSPGLGPVAKNVLQLANRNPVAVNALNISHSDSGLVGVYLVANGSHIGPYIKAAISGLKELASSGPNEETLNMAKKLAEVTTHLNSEDTAQLAADQAAQILASGDSVSPSDFVKSLQSVTVEDIKKAASRLTSKLSIASFGKIHQVPYIDEL
uniref:Peptidase M16 C-terminal domain-containing protein n=1 Tax=Ditylenchus dipsaci TaxID=166011 RepID=A0A915E0X8_9BILA